MISKRKPKKTENTLDKIAKHYEGRFNEISAAVIITNPEGKIISVNLEAEELTGYEASELKKTQFFNLFAEDNHQRIRSLFKTSKTAATDFQKLFEHNVIVCKRSKRRIVVDMGFHSSRFAGKPLYIFTLQDITDLKNSENKIREANDYVTSIINSMNESVIVTDAQKRIKTANNFALTLLGYSEEELKDQEIDRACGFSEVDDFANSGLLKAAKGNYRFEAQFTAKSGKKIPVMVSVSALQQGQTKQSQYVWVAMDLTEKKEAERFIAEQQMMLIQAAKMSDIGVMASGIAHEINNPMHVISGRCEILDMNLTAETVDVAASLASVEVINKMVSRVDKIVTGLRVFSRDQQEAVFEVCNIQDIVSETLLLCESRIRHSGIDLRLLGCDQSIELMGRATQISQVILNLLNNAYDAVEASVTLERQENRFIALEVESIGDKIIISVSNSGERIARDTAEKIFNPFFTTKQVGKGTGLGLSISKSIVEQHGGEIIIDWDNPHTCFVIRLPREAILASAS